MKVIPLISFICRFSNQFQKSKPLNISALPCDITDNMCLFNVKLDPCEFNNLAQKEPDILNELILLTNKYVPVEAGNKPADPMANPKYWNYTWTYWKDYE